MKKEEFFLIDGNAILTRYFFAMPEKFSPEGINLNGFAGFLNFLTTLGKSPNILVLFDRCSKNFRKELFSSYKSNRRPMDENLYHQSAMAQKFLEDLSILVDYSLNYEADDLIGSYATSHPGEKITIVSTDKDLLQLVSENVSLYNPFRKVTYTREMVFQDYKIYPEDFALFLALCGDSSDNIPGIEGVGPKTALHILSTCKEKDQFAKLFPKYDFTSLDQMLALTTVCRNVSLRHNLLSAVADSSQIKRQLKLLFSA